MTWFKVDDGWWAHPKTLALSPTAGFLWVRAGSWSGQQLTDGFIPKAALMMLGADVSIADELVHVGYWQATAGGYQFTDWENHQQSAVDARSKQQAARERMRALRKRSQNIHTNDPRTNPEQVTNEPRTDRERSQIVRASKPRTNRKQAENEPRTDRECSRFVRCSLTQTKP